MSIRVLVVESSSSMAEQTAAILRMAADLEVVGTATDHSSALEMVNRFRPEVLTLALDPSHPGFGDFFERLIGLPPIGIVIITASGEAGSEIILRALEFGAVDFISRPPDSDRRAMSDFAAILTDKIRATNDSTKHRQGYTPIPSTLYPPGRSKSPSPGGNWGRVIFVGASTGGTEALKTFLTAMPASSPPILVVQHMPSSFTGSFARRLDSLCAPHVLESQGNEKIEPGTIYIAPGHSHLTIRQSGTGYATELLQTLPVNRHRPSVDVLFESAAAVVGHHALGVILTGMGKDGAQGLLHMRQVGARTFGQDEKTCVVYGMPREAYLVGAVEEQAPLEELARRVLACLGIS